MSCLGLDPAGLTVVHSAVRHASLDPLYGRLDFPPEIWELRDLPIIQRLRHVRLSNIDSVDLPGIANLSRYEHVLGTCHLAGMMPLLRKVPNDTALLIQAAAMTHDWGIPPFGHLVEEAAQYLSNDYPLHELKLARQYDLSTRDAGGADQQLLYGRETGLTRWFSKAFGDGWRDKEKQLTSMIKGEGRYGQCIAGTVDLDNLDNVVRVAFHMGLEVRRTLPEEVASCIVDVNETCEVVFDSNAVPFLEEWVRLRWKVYGRLMLSPTDFVGKTMLIVAAYRAFEEGSLVAALDWKKTDIDFVGALLKSDVDDVRDTVQRWLVGDN